MLALLLLAASGATAGEAAGPDFAALVSGAVSAEREESGTRRYLLPDLDEPEDGRDGVEVRLRWRKVRVTVPIDGLQPPL